MTTTEQDATDGMDFINFDCKALSLDELKTLIRHHDTAYDAGMPEIADVRYDELMRELARRAPNDKLLSQLHSMEVSATGKVTHKVPMLSLNKAYSLAEVMDWAKEYARSADEEFLIEPKYDGISAIYHNGVLATRGDGFFGENISDKLPLIELEKKDYTGKLDREARGEILIRGDRFGALQKTLRSKANTVYKNTRNILAPLMKLKEEHDILAAKLAMEQTGSFLTLVDYGKISRKVRFADLETEWAKVVAEYETLPYPQDGIVIKLADLAYRESCGATAHHPRGEIAFKFQNLRAESTLLDVEWSFGKSALTPVASIAPVELGGITIVHATLHNLQNILDRDIQIGDAVVVERAGDVIPHIVSSAPGASRRSAVIENCPCCQTKLLQKGPELCCPNPECFETRLQNLVSAVKNIGIEHLGEPNLRRMMQILNVRTLKDIFSLSKSDLLKLDNFQERSAANLHAEIQAAREVRDYQLLSALNIPHIGINMAKVILREIQWETLRSSNEETLSAIRGIGPERAGALFRELRNQADFLNEILCVVRLIHSSGENAGPTVCFTGKMPEKRSFYEALARANGYGCVDEVSSSLSLLVAADLASNSSKLEKARKLGVEIQPLADFLVRMKELPPEPSASAEPEQLSLF